MDNNKDQLFRQKAQQAGYTPQQIDAYLANKITSTPEQSGGFLQRKTLPLIGGAIGGIAGGALGGGWGGVPGAIAGYAGADILRKELAKLLGQQVGPINPVQSVTETGTEALKQGAYQTAGVGIAKGAGALFSPIKSLSGVVTKSLAKTPAEVSFPALQEKFVQEELPKFAKRGLADEAKQAWGVLTKKLGQMVEAQGKEVTGKANVMNIRSLPVLNANEVKKLIPKLGNLLKSPTTTETVQSSYGGLATPGLEVPKQYVRLLADEIRKNSPMRAKIANALMSMLYKGQEIPEQLSYLLPWQMGRGLRYTAGLPIKTMQGMFPTGGGARQALSATLLGRLFGMGGGE